MSEKGLAVLFPGIGYTNDRSLLYFSGRVAVNAGYELLRVTYGGFPPGVKGDREKMKDSFVLAGKQAEEQLRDVRWEEYEEILFISKSIGTVVASAYARERNLAVRSVIFTPLEETFLFLRGDALVFHGTADPWAETAKIRAACEKCGVPLFITEGANHSLETGDAVKDVETLTGVVEKVKNWC